MDVKGTIIMVKFPMGQLPFVLRFWWLWELVAFVVVGHFIGYGWAFLLIILGSLFGFLLIRRQGAAMMKQMKQDPMMGAFAMMNGVQTSMVLLSGFFFMIPGFLTDIIGLICLVPVFRRGLINRVLAMSMKGFTKGAANESPQQPAQPNTIEGEFWRDRDKD